MIRSHILHSRFFQFSALLCLILLGAIAAIYIQFLSDLPPISAVEKRMVRPTTQILDRNGRLLYEVVDPEAGKQINLKLDALPDACVQATLATEDSRFYQHPGVDPIAIMRALWQNYRAGGQVVSGGSTLTQQLARNLLMEPAERYEQSVRRKLREAWLAWWLDYRYTKNELLTLYINQTYYGNFAFGLEAAAQIFFAKPAEQLSKAECALLAGLIQYPTGYNPLQDPDVAKKRQLTVLRLMRESGYVTKDEATLIAKEPLRYRSRLFDIEAPHFVMYIQDLLTDRLGVDRLRDGGLQVTTTLDLALQHQAESSIRYRLDQLNCRVPGLCDELTDPNRRVDNAAAIVLDNQTGEILSMVGSPDYFDKRIQGNVNAALSLRQPGSAIKPFTYAAALDPRWSSQRGQQPLTAASIIADLPTIFYVKDSSVLPPKIAAIGARGNSTGENPINNGEGDGNVPYAPVNYDRLFHGPVSVRTALASSYNIPAVKVLDHIGIETLQQISARAGISSFTGEHGLALTLGGGEVQLLELAAAFGIFREGIRLEPKAILSIEDMGSSAVSRQPSAVNDSSLVISPGAAYLITEILSDDLARLPAFGEGSVLELPFDAAVKTGTTTDWRDNWTIGYSTQRIVGVWVGNADNSPMLDVSGIDGAGPIWHDLMQAAHTTPPPSFQRPDGIVEISICGPSGLRPSINCPRTRYERFLEGTEPTRMDEQFQAITIDLATDQRAQGHTPIERRQERVYWMLPPAYHDWMVSQGIPIAPPERIVESESDRSDSIHEIAVLAPSSGSQALILSAPTSNTAYQIHPGLPRQNQRIQVTGYSADGRLWETLRLVKDGQRLTQVTEDTRLSSWWRLEPGEHRFWLEGRETRQSEFVRSTEALVVVREFERMSSDQ